MGKIEVNPESWTLLKGSLQQCSPRDKRVIKVYQGYKNGRFYVII